MRANKIVRDHFLRRASLLQDLAEIEYHLRKNDLDKKKLSELVKNAERKRDRMKLKSKKSNSTKNPKGKSGR